MWIFMRIPIHLTSPVDGIAQTINIERRTAHGSARNSQSKTISILVPRRLFII